MILRKDEPPLDKIAAQFGMRKSNLLYYFPDWRAKTVAERKAHKAKHPAWQ